MNDRIKSINRKQNIDLAIQGYSAYKLNKLEAVQRDHLKEVERGNQIEEARLHQEFESKQIEEALSVLRKAIVSFKSYFENEKALGEYDARDGICLLLSISLTTEALIKDSEKVFKSFEDLNELESFKKIEKKFFERVFDLIGFSPERAKVKFKSDTGRMVKLIYGLKPWDISAKFESGLAKITPKVSSKQYPSISLDDLQRIESDCLTELSSFSQTIELIKKEIDLLVTEYWLEKDDTGNVCVPKRLVPVFQSIPSVVDAAGFLSSTSDFNIGYLFKFNLQSEIENVKTKFAESAVHKSKIENEITMFLLRTQNPEFKFNSIVKKEFKDITQRVEELAPPFHGFVFSDIKSIDKFKTFNRGMKLGAHQFISFFIVPLLVFLVSGFRAIGSSNLELLAEASVDSLLVGVLLLVLGFISPRLVFQKSRIELLKLFGILFLLCFVLVAVFAPEVSA